MRAPEVIVFSAIFAVVCAVGVAARYWRPADLKRLDEWALGGRRFGTIVTWFLQGGSLYTTYAFVAVPGLVYGSGAIGFFALPYTVVAFCLAYVVKPPLWR